MEIFKKLADSLSAFLNAEPEITPDAIPDIKPKAKAEIKTEQKQDIKLTSDTPKQRANKQPSKQANKTVNKQANKQANKKTNKQTNKQTNAKPDIYYINPNMGLSEKFPKIGEEYERALQSYHSIKKSNFKVYNYAKSFIRLNKVLYMILCRICAAADISCDNKDLKQLCEYLPQAGFNNEQMDVVQDALLRIDAHKDESVIVTEEEIKKHFISVAVIIKILISSESGANIGYVSCELEPLRNAHKYGFVPSQIPDTKMPDITCDAITEKFSKAKQENRSNHLSSAVAVLQELICLSVQKLCKDYDIKITNKDNWNKLINTLLKRRIIDKPFKDCAEKVFSYTESYANGKKPKKKQVTSLIGTIGCTIIHNYFSNDAKLKSKYEIARLNNEPMNMPLPSFKEMEKKSQICEFDFNKEYPQLAMFLETAQKRITNGEYKEALSQYRNALEFMVNTLCKSHDIEMESKITLFDKIELLYKTQVITEIQLGIMHKARTLGNDGAHYSLDSISENDARSEADLIAKIRDIFTNIMIPVKGVKNAPMPDPDFYSNSRKYYGLWTYAAQKESLLLDMNYVKLKRRADDGDIEAMLDLATGFLPQPSKMQWGFDRLILFPDLQRSGYRAWNDPYDARYYFWILKAAIHAFNDWIGGKIIPLKYIATALAEGIKYMLDSLIYKEFAKPDWDYINDYHSQHYLSDYLFDESLTFDEQTICDLALMLICMLDEYKKDMVGKASIISPVNDLSISSIQSYVYMYNYLTNPNKVNNLPQKLLIDVKDSGKKFKNVVENREELFKPFFKLSRCLRNNIKYTG